MDGTNLILPGGGGKPYFDSGYNFASTAQSVTANEGIFYRYDPSISHAIAGLGIRITTPSGNCKVGVYSCAAPDAALASLSLVPIQVSSAIAVTVTGNWQTFSLPASAQVVPGRTYFIGLAFDNGTVTVERNGDTAGIMQFRNRCVLMASAYSTFSSTLTGFAAADKTFVLCTT